MPGLSPEDIALHAKLRISPSTLEAFGVRRVDDVTAREALALGKSRYGDMGGVVYPYFIPGQASPVTHRLRRDHPEIENGKPKNKYLSGYGDRRHLYFAARKVALLAVVAASVIIVESEKAALATFESAQRTGRDVLPIALGGCWSWRGRIGKTLDPKGASVDEIGVLPDFGLIEWTSRDVVILFDSNVNTNRAVQMARRELAAELTRRGAKVRFATLPIENDINGPDDYLGKHGDTDYWALLDGAKPAVFGIAGSKAAAPIVDDMPSTFTGADGRYVFSVLDGVVEFIADRVRWERNRCTGYVTVRSVLPGAKTTGAGTLVATSVNLDMARSRQDLAGLLAARAKTSDVDWMGYLEDFWNRISDAESTGTPPVPITSPALRRTKEDVTAYAFGMPIRLHHPQTIFAPGGTFKSILGLAVLGELAQQGKRSLLLDWEMDGGDQSDRASALRLPDAVMYRHCANPLAVEIDDIRREVHEHAIDFVMIDSVALACGGPVEESQYVLAFFSALRRLERGSLLIAHTRGEDGDQRPFGSVFWHNLSRDTWFLKRTDEEAIPGAVAVGVFHRKTNFKPVKPFALALAIAADPADSSVLRSVSIRRTEIAEVAELAEDLKLWERIRHALRGGAKTIAELSNELDKERDDIRRTLNRKNKLFTLVTGNADGVHRWGLKHNG